MDIATKSKIHAAHFKYQSTVYFGFLLKIHPFHKYRLSWDRLPFELTSLLNTKGQVRSTRCVALPFRHTS